MTAVQILRIGILFSLLYVLIGAFGAHALEDQIADKRDIFNTAKEYHIIHSIALVLTGLLSRMYHKDLSKAAYSFVFGLLFFSGSLYLMSILKLSLGILTPLGGVGFIIGWALLIYHSLNFKS
jgi:uncharacterized membrane protein YgdD (TMEM256/DUF423 family)